ncbi:TetR/AcrR family transcriptional regulator [Pontibacter diazotrophicus]|uniref:TetR/AcrR family transcriptional regulator n=1 Tax=Pontibacter diazotrophicus TaxID=1400979 RepID=A0A3D8LDS0_9BACT|nr:TetR/AcrR family transcriptional regulator [Pontibacter diazotrophicus]RDV15493.1 TetR/AcrR family transcriptional regulator [Pontibacter diazotrophicus]
METAEKTDTRSKILEAAFGMFCQRGIKSVSMDDIAQHLAMSKKTLYKWFKNKDEVVYEALANFLSFVQQDCQSDVENAGNAIEELFHAMEMTKKIFTSIHPSIFHDLQKYHRDSWNLWQQHKVKFILEMIKQNIHRGMQEGLFRQDLDVETIARLRLVMIEMPFDAQLFPPYEFNIAKVQKDSLEHYMLGIATLKGHKLINEYKQIIEEE